MVEVDGVDYPAAHSMDTSWFAIDNDGHVAIFRSGEAGCVPEAAHVGDDEYPYIDTLLALPVTGFRMDPQGQHAVDGPNHVVIHDNLDPATPLCMFLSDLVPVDDLLARLDPEPLAISTGRAVRITARDRDALAELHARQACLGCYREWSGGHPHEIAAHGVYRYEHTCENWIAGPYARTAVPDRPLTIDEVPQLVRDRAIAFDGRFAETQELQPAEHWECRSSEGMWLATDHRTARPFPDREASWEYFVEHEPDPSLHLVAEPLVPGPAKPRWWK